MLCSYYVRTLASEGNLEVLFEGLEGIKWHIIGLSEVQGTGEEFIELKNGQTLCYRGQKDKKEYGVDFFSEQRINRKY